MEEGLEVNNWSRVERLTLFAVIATLIGVVTSLLIPEVRNLVGLRSTSESSHPQTANQPLDAKRLVSPDSRPVPNLTPTQLLSAEEVERNRSMEFIENDAGLNRLFDEYFYWYVKAGTDDNKDTDRVMISSWLRVLKDELSKT